MNVIDDQPCCAIDCMATGKAIVEDLCHGALMVIEFMLCLPRFIFRRMKRWSKLGADDMDAGVSCHCSTRPPPPTWATHEGLADIKIESSGDAGQARLLCNTGSNEQSGTALEVPSDNTIGEHPISTIGSWGVNNVPVINDSQSMARSPFTAGIPGLRAPNPGSKANHSNGFLLHESHSPLAVHQENPRDEATDGNPSFSDRCELEGGRERAKTSMGRFPLPNITRSRSAPNVGVKLKPPSAQDAEGKGEHESKSVEGSLATQQPGVDSSQGQTMCAVSSDIGQRKAMEDCNVVVTGEDMPSHKSPVIKAFVGIFDGHNGPEAAKYSSENLLGYFLQAYDGEQGIGAALKSAFQTCEDALLCRWKEGLFSDSGTTALACAISSDRHLHLANVGDCRAVLSRAGRAEALTKDHKPGSPTERARILGSGGFLDSDDYLNGEIGVSRAMGDFHLDSIKKPQGSGPLSSEPDLYDIALGKDCEFVVLGSDGLWDVLSNQRAVDIARCELDGTQSAEKTAEKLVFEAKCKDSRDNITVGILVLQPLPLPPRRKRFVNSRLRLNSKSLMDLKQAIQTAQDTALRPV